MLLYEKQNNTICVYKLSALEEDLMDYRIEEMKKIPGSQQLFYAKQVYNNEQYRDQLDEYVFSYEKADRRLSTDNTYHILLSDNQDITIRNEILHDLYNGKFVDKKVIRILYDKIMYYLLTEDHYIEAKYRPFTKYLKNIIQIPESLYILQLFEQGKYDILINQGIDITKILELYNFEYFGKVAEEELINFDRYEITNDSHIKVLAKAERDKKLINMVSKRIKG